MKKLKKCIVKIDPVLILIIGAIVFGWSFAQETDATIKSVYKVFGIPTFLFILENILQKKQENNYYNIDLYMKEDIKDKMVWKLRTDNSKDDIVYLCIKNTGKIDIFSLYIKVIKHDGVIGYFRVCDMLNIDKECIVCVPYKRKTIKEIVITCGMQIESRTKKFNGIQSGNEGMFIFSNCEMLDAERYAVYHEKRFDEFEKLERFMI